jgi:hypothetical protein
VTNHHQNDRGAPDGVYPHDPIFVTFAHGSIPSQTGLLNFESDEKPGFPGKSSPSADRNHRLDG